MTRSTQSGSGDETDFLTVSTHLNFLFVEKSIIFCLILGHTSNAQWLHLVGHFGIIPGGAEGAIWAARN